MIYVSQYVSVRVRRHVELAREFARWVEEDDRFEIVAPVPLNLVCFRHRAGDDASPPSAQTGSMASSARE